MKALKHIPTCLLVCSLVVTLQPLQGLAQQNSDATKTGSQPAVAERDGQHDFEFNIDTWKTHISRLQRPSAGSTCSKWLFGDHLRILDVWNRHSQMMEAKPGK